MYENGPDLAVHLLRLNFYLSTNNQDKKWKPRAILHVKLGQA